MVPLPPPTEPGIEGAGTLPPPPPKGPTPPPPPPPTASTALPSPASPVSQPGAVAVATRVLPAPPVPTDTEPTEPSVPAARRRRRWWIPLVVVAGLLVSVVIGASVVEVPYYGIAPGDARPVQPRIDVEGAQVFSSEGEVLFVTVSVPRLTALGAVMGWLDPDVDVVEEDLILGDQSPQENRENNLRLMGYSKDFATYVALDKLGYDVQVTDGGVAIDSLCMATAADGVTCAEEAPAAATLQVRDLITAIDGRPVNLPPDIGAALTGRQPGEQVTVKVQREGQADPIEVPVTLTSSEDGRTILGIIPNPLPPDTIKFEFPVTVLIDSGAVGGPSAGLAFTLALLDELTPGELTGGKKVAATGTITPSGAVGEIGGLPQKTVAVEREGAELFLVPLAELPEAQAKAEGTNLKVVGVETLDDALAALQEFGGSGLPSSPARLAG